MPGDGPETTALPNAEAASRRTPALRFDAEGKADKIAEFVDATSPSRSGAPEGRGVDAASTDTSPGNHKRTAGSKRQVKLD